MLSIIVAIGENNEIGKNNDLIWRFREDLKFFEKMTAGHKIIIGRKTFESLPKVLPDRKHFVLTSNPKGIIDHKDVAAVKYIEGLLNLYQNCKEEIFVVGGATVYEQLLPFVTKIYITEIHSTFPKADAFFPNFDKTLWHRKVIDTYLDNGILYDHVKYRLK